MDYDVGIDVALEQSSVCVVDATGRIVRVVEVASEPEALVTFWPVSRRDRRGSAWRLARCRNGCTPA